MPATRKGLLAEELSVTNGEEEIRYVRIRAVNVGQIPVWHDAAGRPAWLFADDIVLEP